MKGLSPITVDEKEYSGIDSGLPSRVFRAVDISSLQGEAGWIYDSRGRMEAWKLEGVREESDSMIFYGPRVEGEFISAETLSLDRFERIIRLFQMIREKNSPYSGFYSRGWVFLEDGRVLVLPVSLMDFIRKSEKEEYRMKNWYPYNHPDRPKLEGMDYTAGILASLILSGKHPYAPLEAAEDDRNEQLRQTPALSPELMIPGLKPAVSSRIKESLKSEKGELGKWTAVIELWRREGAVSELEIKEREEILNKAELLLEKGEKSRQRRQIWRRRNSLYIAVAAVVIFLGVIISTPIRKSLEPPATMDMSAYQVVEAYYGSFNSLDQQLMEDSIDKKLGKDDVGELTNIFVTSRVRMGYEGSSGIISAPDWVESGRIAPDYGESVYGVTEVEIHDLGGGQYRVVYEKWMPGSSDESRPEEMQPIPPYGLAVTDVLTLEQQKKGNWLITARDRTMREIPYP